MAWPAHYNKPTGTQCYFYSRGVNRSSSASPRGSAAIHPCSTPQTSGLHVVRAAGTASGPYSCVYERVCKNQNNE
eukprot:8744730-Pyramimonas_sp.AAC.2